MSKPINSSDFGAVASAFRDAPSGHGNTAFGVYIATVKSNIDAEKLNRTKVWVSAFGSAEEDVESWIMARPMTTHGGATPQRITKGEEGKDYEKVQKSYGTFTPAADIGSTVIVAFIDGDINQCVLLGSLWENNLIHAIPGIGDGFYEDESGAVKTGPVTEYNHTANAEPTAKKDIRVRHRVLHDSLKKQGLDLDPFRGFSSSSSQRESPSRLHGTLTRGQQQFVMDDGDLDGNNRLIRLRTRNGAQILLSDSCGFVYIISKDGNSWVEVSNDGSVSVYGSSHINLHAGKDLNLVAQGAVNIEGNDINIKSRSADVRIESNEEFHALSGGDMFHTSKKNADVLVIGNYKETAQKIDMNGPRARLAKQPPLNDLTVNTGFRQSIATSAPEAEPWGGHSGCGDGTNTNAALNDSQTEAAGIPADAAATVAANIQSAYPRAGGALAAPSAIPVVDIPVTASQLLSGGVNNILGSLLGLQTDISTQGGLGLLATAVKNVLGLSDTGFLSDPNAKAIKNPDRYGEYPSPPISRISTTARTVIRDENNQVLRNRDGSPKLAVGTSTVDRSTQPEVRVRSAGVAPRGVNDDTCENYGGSTSAASSADEYGCLMIACFEAYRGTAYQDGPNGYASVGYGRLLTEKNDSLFSPSHSPSGGVTEEEAWSALQQYKSIYEKGVLRLTGGKPLPQHVFNGVMSFLYQTGENRTLANGEDLSALFAKGDYPAVARAIQGHGKAQDASRRSLEAQLIVNNCLPFRIVSKGSAKVREEKLLEGMRALGSAIRHPGGHNGNRGYTFAVKGNTLPSGATPNSITSQQAKSLLTKYAADERPAVSGLARQLLA